MQRDNKSNFNRPGVYQVKIDGELDHRLSGSFGGMQIKVHHQGEKICTIMTGEIPDQAALNGILNGLYDMHFTVLSVAYLEVK